MNRPLYLSYFNLREPPFALTSNTNYFFPGGDRGATLDALLYAVMNTEGVITVTGEVGSGKTTMARMLVEKKPRHLELVYVANPAINSHELVFLIARELRMRVNDLSLAQVLLGLQRRLITLHSRGKRVAILIDEAHGMSADTLEQIRLLSNLETNEHKLLHVLLVGQDELNQTLALQQMRPLRERITERFRLEPLAHAVIAEYLRHRLRRAGGNPQCFEAKAIAAIAGASQGLIRRVNILAEKSLVAAFAHETQTVTGAHVRAAITDAQFGELPTHSRWFSPSRWRLWPLAGRSAAQPVSLL